jgi:hypothetical protein
LGGQSRNGLLVSQANTSKSTINIMKNKKQKKSKELTKAQKLQMQKGFLMLYNRWLAMGKPSI